MTGQLFTHYFLTDGIRATPEWQASAADPETFAAFRESLLHHYDTLARSADPNEAVTEADLIRPVLEVLGWADYLPQQRTAGNEDIPDHLLFADAEAKDRAAAERNAGARAGLAIAVQESKRFGLSLDERDRESGFHARSPHSQILRYLATAEIESESRLRWGLLTNGRVWRLYDYRARPRASGWFEADLADLLQPGREEDLRVFHLLFRRASFTPQEGAAHSFLEAALAEGRRYEEQVAQDLSGVVFESVFPALAQTLAEAARTGRLRRRPAGGPQGGADLPLPPALRALRRGPGAAAGQRLALRRLRPAQARARRHRPPDGGGRHVFDRGRKLLRPARRSLPHHRPGRSVHRPAALTTAVSSPATRRRCWRRCASPTPTWLPSSTT